MILALILLLLLFFAGKAILGTVFTLIGAGAAVVLILIVLAFKRRP